jgi:hypothetical protein
VLVTETAAEEKAKVARSHKENAIHPFLAWLWFWYKMNNTK